MQPHLDILSLARAPSTVPGAPNPELCLWLFITLLMRALWSRPLTGSAWSAQCGEVESKAHLGSLHLSLIPTG